MTVDERRGSTAWDGRQGDKFPVGMRVLAVDDDPTCLKFLERLLHHCQYHVTTTNEAITALKMLRDNKHKFDLVISDVHMPDMDGFKLLELVGLEMDLPVIMLSGNSDTKAVMKGITHGACDYLLKPVRLEELKNIWQHVVRRRKFDCKDHINNDHMDNCEKPLQSNIEGAQGPITNDASDRNGKIDKKRKDEEDDDDCDNGHETEDSSTQKKPRVVWSDELHRKFLVAVFHLGIDKAVPKRILDLMNVERLTRENVASHLQLDNNDSDSCEGSSSCSASLRWSNDLVADNQKYRLYLKRISATASQQANIVAAFGGKDSSYLQMGPFDGLGNYHTSAGSRQLPSVASYQSAGVIGRLNIPNGLGVHGLASSGMIQLGHTHNTTNTYIHDLRKLQCINLPVNQHGNLFQGKPASLELDQLQQHNSVNETNNPLPGVFSDTRLSTGNSGNSCNSFLNVTNSSLMLQANDQQTQSSGLCNQSSVTAVTLSQGPLQISGAVSSFPDLGRCNDTWQGAAQLTGYSANTLPLRVPFSHDNLSCSTLKEIIPPITTHVESNPHDASLRSTIAAPLHDPRIRRDLQPSANSLGKNILLLPTGSSEVSKFSLIGSLSNSLQKLEEPKQNQTRKSNLLSSSLTSTLPNHSIINPISQNLSQNNGLCNRKIDVTIMNQSNFGAPFVTQHNVAVKLTDDGQLKDEYFLEPSLLPDGLSSNCCSSFDDLMNAMIKQHEDATFMDGDMRCDNIFPLETCM